MLRSRVLFGALVLSGLAGVAHASLIGDTIDGEYLVFGVGPNIFDNDNAVVGDDPEFGWDTVFENVSADVKYDFDAESLWIFYQNVDDDGDPGATITEHTVEFSDLDWFDDMGMPISGEIVGLNLVSGSAPELISYGFTSHGLSFEWEDIGVDDDGSHTIMLHFDIIVEHDTPAIPEPATTTLLALGLAGVAYARRRAA